MLLVGRGLNMDNNVYNIEDYYKLLELQKRYEEDLVEEDEMSLEEINNLIKLYKSQIRKLGDEVKIKLLKRKNGDN